MLRVWEVMAFCREKASNASEVGRPAVVEGVNKDPDHGRLGEGVTTSELEEPQKALDLVGDDTDRHDTAVVHGSSSHAGGMFLCQV